MNKSLLFVSAAASLLAVSCSQDKQAAVDAATTPAADTAVVVNDSPLATDTVAYRTEAERLADRVAQDLRLTDDAVRTRVTNTYYTRGRQLRDLDTRYATDTTGRYAAQRAINDNTDQEVRTYVTDPALQRTYAENRNSYYAGTPYSAAPVVVETRSAPARRKGPAIVKYDNDGGDVKIEYANGTKVKIDKDGDRKTKYANGRKVKRDADDGEVKVKN